MNGMVLHSLPSSINNYTVIDEIREGERCQILKVKDKDNIELALKVFDGEERQLFHRDWTIMRELSIADKLKCHPLVPNVFPIDTENELEVLYYPLELLGDDLRKFYSSGKRLELGEALQLMRFISELLMLSHDYKREKPFRIEGITHGNLDLSHIVRVPHHSANKWKLIGFRYNPTLQYYEESDNVAYVPLIVPPEFKETKKITQKTDIFQLGAIGYELITGRKIIQHDLKMPSRVKHDVPFYIDEIFRRALDEDLEKRGSMRDLNGLIVETIKRYEKKSMTVNIERPDSLFEKAKYRINSGELKFGLEKLWQLVLLHPSYTDGVLLLLSYIAENSNYDAYDVVIQRIKKNISTIENEKKKDLASNLFKAGASMLLEGVDGCCDPIKNALLLFQSAAKPSVMHLTIKVQIADLLLLCGHPKKSRDIYKNLLKYKKMFDIDVNHIKNNLGVSYFEMSKIHMAKKFFEKGKTCAQLNNLGVVNVLDEKFDEAEKLFLKANEKSNEDSKWKIHSNLAIALYCQQKFGDAVYHSLTSTRLKGAANNADAVLLLMGGLAKTNEDAANRLKELEFGCQKYFIEKVAMRISNKEFDKVLYTLISRI